MAWFEYSRSETQKLLYAMHPNQSVKKNSLIAISAILAILSCIEAVIAITCFALCCRAETYIQVYDPATQRLSFIPIVRHQNVMIAPFNFGAPYGVGLPYNMEKPYSVGQAISIGAAHNFDAPLNVGDSYNVGSQDPPMNMAPPYEQIVGGLQNNNLPPYADKVDEIVDNKAVDAF
ncbi:hypothetical protein HELRODRAFT_165466 [Helobdella robusta]|uniref:Uncharacterized protein n=1 Tax=Helobdella robusta TaxID=6412 RepID=T1EWU7_HELRO|nr:hypothetical protein HELRODRAFT_165466 [Helobdella robusta]ESN91432.1 hypothetical protein HELRODRAFT_165466 [Helobdella robusta]